MMAQDVDGAEAGGRGEARRIALEEQPKSKNSGRLKLLKKAIGVSRFALFILCILLGPDLNETNLDHSLFDMSAPAVHTAYKV